jgi:hypothetical protein
MSLEDHVFAITNLDFRNCNAFNCVLDVVRPS